VTDIPASKVSASEFTRRQTGADSLVSSILEQSTECILTVDQQARIIQASRGATNLFQIERDSIVGRSLDTLTWIDDQSGECLSLTELQNLIRSSDPVAYDGVFVTTSDDPRRRYDLKISPVAVHESAHALVFLQPSRIRERDCGLGRDLKRQFDIVLNSAEGRLWEWQPSSGAYREFGLWQAGLGYGQDEYCTTLFALLARTHPDDADELKRRLDKLARGEAREVQMDCRQRHKNGEYLWLRCHAEVSERDENSQPTVISGTYVDTSELTHTAELPKQKEIDLNLALESSRQGIWEWQAKDNMFRVSTTWQDLFGYSQADIAALGGDISPLMHPDDIGTWIPPLHAALKGEVDSYESEQRVRKKGGGYLTCLTRGRVLQRDESGRATRLIGSHIDVTETKYTQGELRESNERLNIALTNSRQGIWEWAPDSDAFKQYGFVRYGYDNNDAQSPVTGTEQNQRTHPDDKEIVARHLSAYLRGESDNLYTEIRALIEDGSYRTYLIQGQAVERAADGRITRMLGTHTDISDLKADSESLELALANAGQGMSKWRPGTDAVEFSDSWYDLFGYDVGEIANVRTDFTARMHPDDLEMGGKAIADTLSNRADGYDLEYRFRCKNGEYLWVMDRSRVVERDANGTPTLIIGTYVNITAKKTVERELEESRRVLEMLLDTIPDIVYWKDGDGRILGANRQFAVSAGFNNSSEVVGLTDESFPWSDYAEMYRADDREVMASGKPKLGIRQAFVDASGEPLLIESNKIPVFDESGRATGIVGISQEITEKRQHEKRLEKIAESITHEGSERLLDALTKGAADLCDVAIAAISKLDATGTVATVVSAFPSGDLINARTFSLEGTPAGAALNEGLCVFSGDVRSEFPTNNFISSRGIESYVAKALVDNEGIVVGIISLIDTKPLSDPNYAISALDIIGATAANELSRELREIELSLSEERYRTIYDNMPTMICMVDGSQTIVDINKAWTEGTGFTSAESMGSRFTQFLDCDSAQWFSSQEELSDTVEFEQNIKLKIVCKNRTAMYASFKGVRAVSPEGVPGTMIVLEDITDRTNAQQQLKLAATAFETHEALLIRDAQKRILRVNSAFKNVTGCTDAELLGKEPTTLSNSVEGDSETARIWSIVDQEGAWDGERVNYRADGSTFSAWQTITAVTDDSGEITHYVENYTDISELKQALADAERLALYDPLTELPNRRYLAEQLEASIFSFKRHGTTSALLFIDLDQFKNINDSLGHAVGDEILIQVAKRLAAIIRAEDTIARLGGDEFVIVLSDLGKEPTKCVDHARRIADKIHGELGKTYHVETHDLNITPTIGVTLFPEEGKTVDTILQEADSAMYQGKADGRNITKFFHPSMQSEAQERLGLERDLRTAIERDELELFFQPQYDRDCRIFAAETLLRWQHPNRGSVSPSVFIPIAEDSGLILDIGRWVFRRAVECLRRWDNDDTMFFDHLAINVNSRQFRSPDFVRETIRDLVSVGVPPQRVVIEVTEGTVIDNFKETALKMAQLRDIGIRFSVDDFGIGYSSLSYLSRLPLDQLKIDRSFVTDVLEDANDAVIAETIIGMGNSLHFQTIAEGVENIEQLQFLRDKGCHGFQGFLFSKAVQEHEFLTLDRQWRLP
jgi:diguanylate cyclase (GGDEF)-like protein/PAS domain S-box-containing protein